MKRFDRLYDLPWVTFAARAFLGNRIARRERLKERPRSKRPPARRVKT